MGQSLLAPAPLAPAKVTHAASGSVITSEQRDGKMIHSLAERGLNSQYEVKYQSGGDLMGRTYFVQVGDYLFESPITYFKRYGWDLSPGYNSKPLIDFDRVMDDTCLFCHAGSARFADADGHRLQDTNLGPISCDRCHGDGQAHTAHPTADNIVNPAKLPRAQRDSTCEQCHLEGATRILNRGKKWTDYHAGQTTEETFATFLLSGGSNQGVNAVSHVEQLAQSKCVRATQGKLWCGSCHNPHGEPVANRAAEMKAVCTSCHASLSREAHPQTPAECTSCHMPTGPTTDIPHAALTDHRILRRPSEAVPHSAEAAKVTVWREPAESVRERDLGLAQVLVGYANQLSQLADQGWARLSAIPENQRDPAVLSDFEGRALAQGDVAQALVIGRKIVQLEPTSAKAAMNLGIVLKRAGQPSEAEQELKRAIDLDISLKNAYIELAKLYADQSRMRDVESVVDSYLKFNPQDVVFRLQKRQLDAGHEAP